jgi:transcriptional regulator with XRE-family HTH domain
MTNKRSTNHVDKIIGQRIRQSRRSLSLTQTELAEAVGISFQQVQKYEKGVNRVPASRLYQIADRLGENLYWFFVDPEDKKANISDAA